MTMSHGAMISMEMTGINKEFNELFYEHSFFQQTTAEHIAKLDDTCTLYSLMHALLYEGVDWIVTKPKECIC